MERVAGCILLRLHQKYRLVSVDQIPKVWMRIIGIYKLCFRHGQSSAIHLDRRGLASGAARTAKLPMRNAVIGSKIS